MIRQFTLCLAVLLYSFIPAAAQTSDSLTIRNIYTFSLEQGKAYEWLDHLCHNIGHRLSGSVGAEKAVAYTQSVMAGENYGRVWLQEVMVPRWRRNDVESLTLHDGKNKTPLRIYSLGGSIGTPANGIRANVIEVKNFDELERLGRDKIEGKIVFYNAPFNQHNIHTFPSYGEVGKFRWAGAMNAAKYGAVASINRSLTSAFDDTPHTGSMGYNDTIKRIPGCAISTIGADKLSAALRKNDRVELELLMNCDTLPDTLSYNVIAEIRGSEFPDEIVVVSGHLDSWDKGHGAHDDGAGCVQSMEVLRIFKNLNIKPKRTVRVVLFMNEENGLRGGKQYAKSAKEKNEKHIAAIESDAGGFTPHGFSSVCIDSMKVVQMNRWKNLFEPYGLHIWEYGHGGADINQLKDQGTLLIGLFPDSQRYFDYHHTEIDTFDKINRRELQLGAAAMASLVYLLSEYGVVNPR